jgi:hypothetical protein
MVGIGRSNVDLVGVIGFSTHVTLFTIDGAYKFWVPRQSEVKPTVPNKPGGLVTDMVWAGKKLVNSMARILAVEASIPKYYSRAYLKSRGTILYRMSTVSACRAGCQHTVSYLMIREYPTTYLLNPPAKLNGS